MSLITEVSGKLEQSGWKGNQVCDLRSVSTRENVQWLPTWIGRSQPHLCDHSSQCAGGGEGLLVVENVNRNDEGYYLCTAEVHGTTAAAVCKVTVGGTSF